MINYYVTLLDQILTPKQLLIILVVSCGRCLPREAQDTNQRSTDDKQRTIRITFPLQERYVTLATSLTSSSLLDKSKSTCLLVGSDFSQIFGPS